MSSLSIVYVCTMRFLCVCLSVLLCVWVFVCLRVCVSVCLCGAVWLCTCFCLCQPVNIVCIYLCLVSICVYLRVCLSVILCACIVMCILRLCIYFLVCIFVYVYVSFAFIHTSSILCTWIRGIYTYIHICGTCMYIHVCIYVCVCVFVYTCLHIYIYDCAWHAHAQTQITVAVGWARALYTPFLAWNLYSLPLVLALCGIRKREMVGIFVLIELLFRPWSTDASEAWSCVVLFCLNLRIAFLCVAR